MGKGQFEATKGMSIKDIYITRFLPELMDKIGDPDIYQDIYDRVFKKGRFIEGFVGHGNTNTYTSDFLDIDRNKMSNLDILLNEWYCDSDAFDKSLDLLIRIAKEDKEALKIRDDYLKKHPYRKSHLEEKEEEEEKKKNKEKPKEVVAQEPVREAAYTQTAQDQVASNMAANNIPEQNIYNSTVQRKLLDLRNHFVSYPYGKIPRRSLTIPTVISPERLLRSRYISPFVETSSFDFMLHFNTDYLKYCFDKNAAPNIDNVKEYIDKWESRDGMPGIYSKLYTVFWNLLLVAMDDDLYSEYVSMVSQLAQHLSLDEPIMRDLCRGVKYVLSGKELSPDCDFHCQTIEGKRFLLHKDG